jgi:hypothetical protein
VERAAVACALVLAVDREPGEENRRHRSRLRLALERTSGRVFRCDLRGGERVVADDDLAVLECRYEDAGGVGRVRGRLRTAIARACKASGTPTWSPHDLRHRRISLWHRQGETWALIGARVGQRSLSVTADTYTHVLLDDRELDHPRLAAELGLTDARRSDGLHWAPGDRGCRRRGGTGGGTSRATVTCPARLTRMTMRNRQASAVSYGPCWTRTSDLGIKSPLLYQLS